ncbi:hypothetical protein [Martelella soudanensis]|uniref:hypothetical protein n=1 Tax=unclassified Martelella TaxID=2629616 RepID=UPI0015DDD463|nr:MULTISPECIES: hypothetical protein [unclassified Martelella]
MGAGSSGDLKRLFSDTRLCAAFKRNFQRLKKDLTWETTAKYHWVRVPHETI